jgi:hypothetical protein
MIRIEQYVFRKIIEMKYEMEASEEVAESYSIRYEICKGLWSWNTGVKPITCIMKKTIQNLYEIYKEDWMGTTGDDIDYLFSIGNYKCFEELQIDYDFGKETYDHLEIIKKYFVIKKEEPSNGYSLYKGELTVPTQYDYILYYDSLWNPIQLSTFIKQQMMLTIKRKVNKWEIKRYRQSTEEIYNKNKNLFEKYFEYDDDDAWEQISEQVDDELSEITHACPSIPEMTDNLLEELHFKK